MLKWIAPFEYSIRLTFTTTVYVDLGALSTDTATLAFTFSTDPSTIRTWEIKISQIPCYSLSRWVAVFCLSKINEMILKTSCTQSPNWTNSISVVDWDSLEVLIFSTKLFNQVKLQKSGQCPISWNFFEGKISSTRFPIKWSWTKQEKLFWLKSIHYEKGWKA